MKELELTEKKRKWPGQGGIGDTMGSSTGEIERAIAAGGWAGTDDATSTAPSDQMGNPATPEDEKPYNVVQHDFEECIERDEQSQIGITEL